MRLLQSRDDGLVAQESEAVTGSNLGQTNPKSRLCRVRNPRKSPGDIASGLQRLRRDQLSIHDGLDRGELAVRVEHPPIHPKDFPIRIHFVQVAAGWRAIKLPGSPITPLRRGRRETFRRVSVQREFRPSSARLYPPPPAG